MFSATAFASPGTLVTGALTGLAFGFLLQKGGVTRFRVIVGQFLLRDFTMLKIMLTAMIVGGIGVYGMRAAGLEFASHVKNADLLANALGGLIFGGGMVLLGYCPGTGIAALGDGSRHALPGIAGMLFGTAIYAEVYPWFNAHVMTVGAYGKVTMADVSGLSPWVILLGMALVAGVGFWVAETRTAAKHPAGA